MGIQDIYTIARGGNMGHSTDSSVGGEMGVWNDNGAHYSGDAKASVLGLMLSMDGCGVNWRTWLGAPERAKGARFHTD